MAKKFNYRLEPLLKIRTHKVNEAKEELRSVAEMRLKKEQEIKNQEDYLKTLHKSKKGSVPVSELQSEYHHKSFVKEHIGLLNKDKFELQEIESLKRVKLTEAMKNEKILVKLKEKQILVHTAKIDKEEMSVLDEIAINQHKNFEALITNKDY